MKISKRKYNRVAKKNSLRQLGWLQVAEMEDLGDSIKIHFFIGKKAFLLLLVLPYYLLMIGLEGIREEFDIHRYTSIKKQKRENNYMSFSITSPKIIEEFRKITKG